MSHEPTTQPSSDHWLVRPKTIRLLWIAFIVILVLTVIPDFFIHQYDEFGLEGSFGFYAWFGFGSCVLMVVGAKVLGYVLKRESRYYGD